VHLTLEKVNKTGIMVGVEFVAKDILTKTNVVF